jgi:transmembrane sensor
MDKQRIHILAQKFIDGTATDAEQAELHQWYDAADTTAPIPAEAEALQLRMKKAIDGQTRVRNPWPLRITAAAVTIGILAVSAWMLRKPSPTQVLADQSVRLKQEVKPGGNRARLILGDGSIIDLDSARNGVIGRQGSTRIQKQKDELSYDGNDAGAGTVQYNTLATPAGGQYQLTLPDGSRVWLNAASHIRFPTAFTGNNREVEVQGEAYFEVAQDAAKPFVVKLRNGNDVEVLGTKFNVMAYSSEKKIKTSLLQGAVRIRGKVLKPGQQAQIQEGSEQVRVVNLPYIEDEVAWQQGMFSFNNDELESVMRQLSRWYNVEIAYTTDVVKSKAFTGQISRQEKLAEVLRQLELTETVHFEIANRKVTVLP